MKRKISLSMCCIAAFSVLITALMISLVLYNRNYKNMTNYIQNEAEYMAAAMNYNGVEYLDSVKDVHGLQTTVTLFLTTAAKKWRTIPTVQNLKKPLKAA